MQCGLVNSRMLTHQAEYRVFEDIGGAKANPTRVGLPVNHLLPESSIGTSIRVKRSRCTPYMAWKRRRHMKEECNVQSQSIIDETTGQLKTITRKITHGKYNGPPAVFYQQRWAYPYHERHLQQQFKELSQILYTHNISSPGIHEETKKAYVQLKSVVIARGKNVKGTLAACLYFACKEFKSPRSIREIANMFDIKQRHITYGIKLVRQSMKDIIQPIQRDASHPLEYIERYALDIFKTHMESTDAEAICISPLYQRFTDLAKFIVSKIDLYSLLDDNTAPSIAAGVLFYTSQHPFFLELYPLDSLAPIHKRTIAKACVTSDVTISKCYKKLIKYKNLFEFL